MTPPRRVIDPLLQRPLRMRKVLSRRPKFHLLADVIPALCAVLTALTRQADLESNLVPGCEGGDIRANGEDCAGRLMAETQGLADEDVAVAVVVVVVKIGAAEAGGLDGNLDLIGGESRDDSVFLHEY